ncbi:MAG TPA: CHAT domain-containing protein [Steroidobacteraceae bacterium]|nr:CHAT domain-containing protein [Steroidobacteraceae bacterium]
MTQRLRRLCAMLLVAASWTAPTLAFDLPPVCAEFAQLLTPGADDQPLPALRATVEKLIETDPPASVALMCKVIPRVERERGADSVDMAWWVGSLGTPLIAFMDRMSEAVPLLEFARPIFEKRLGPYSMEVADIYVAYAWIATRQGRNPDALAAWQSALRVREHNPGAKKIELQKVLVGLAQNQSFVRDFAAAKKSLARAEGILVENGETVSEAAAAIENTYINIAWREEDFAAVRAHAERAIRIEEQMGGPAAQRVPSYVWLGQGLERLDEFEAAEAALRKAVEISESKEGAPLQRHQFSAFTQLAGLLVMRGKPAEARAFALRAIEVGEATRGKDAPALVRPLHYLASAQLALGELPDAQRTYDRASAIVAANPKDIERPLIVAHYRGLARLQLALGERESARASLEAAARAAGDDSKLVIESAATLVTLGALGTGGDAAADHATIDKALALYRTRLPESHPAILRAVAEECAIEIRASPAAARSCDDAGDRIEKSRDADPFLRHDVYALGSELSALRGDPERAYNLAIRALSAASTLGTPDPLWRADFALARVLQSRNDPKLAIFFGKESIAQIERLRGRFVGDERRLERGFLADKVGVYRIVADWLMSAGRIDEGLEVLRMLKAEELFDFVLRDAQWNRENGIELTPAEAALRERYLQLLNADANAGTEIDRLARLSEADRISASERAALEQLLNGQQQREAARAERIRNFLTGGANAAPAPVLRVIQADRLSRELAAFGPDAALAFYLLTDTRLRVLIATRRGQFEYESPVDAPGLRRDIGRYLEAIARREDVSAMSHELYAAVAKPLDEEARRAGAKRLVLWLDGALRYIPFAALSDGRQYLVDRYSIESYVPSEPSGLAVAPRATAKNAALTVRGLGLTRAVAGYDALPAMADELCDVVRGPIEGLAVRGRMCPREEFGNGALTGAGFADAAFTEARLTDLLTEERHFSVLHLGTHFSLRPGNARRSFLLLGDGNRLTLDTIAGLDFHDLRLVTLSACQSGLGGATTDDGREVEGLSAIVQRRGAESVVASLWRVEDRSTARLMRELYDALSSQRGDAAAALRRSQLKLRAVRTGSTRPYEHPYYWGGFLVSTSR